MKKLVLSPGNTGGERIGKKGPVSNVELLHKAFERFMQKAKGCKKKACVCPDAKDAVRGLSYSPSNVREFINGFSKYMKKDSEGNVVIDKQKNVAVPLDEYKDCFAKCASEFLAVLVNRYTGKEYELPIKGWGVHQFTARDGIDAWVMDANIS